MQKPTYTDMYDNAALPQQQYKCFSMQIYGGHLCSYNMQEVNKTPCTQNTRCSDYLSSMRTATSCDHINHTFDASAEHNRNARTWLSSRIDYKLSRTA